MGEDPSVEQFLRFADTCRRRAPLYARLSAGIAGDPGVRRLLLHAPPLQRMPVLLFAAVHALLLEDADEQLGDDAAGDLARFYPNLALDGAAVDGDPYPAFARFCARHEPRIAGILSTRNTQTNEVGRCSLFVPALGLISAEAGPLALVDVGTSAGLNLLLDRYQYHYEPGGTVGGPSSVELTCGTRGPVPVPATLPWIVERVGLDQAPIDVRDPDAARWLEACVWPDQRDRFERLRAAIDLARRDPPPLVTGDAVADVASTIDARGSDGHPVVMSSWALSYLSTDARKAFVAALDAVGAERDLSWVTVDAPAQTPGLPWPELEGTDSAGGAAEQPATHPDLTMVLSTRWRAGRRTVDVLGSAHPHGFWLHWRG